MKSPANPGAPFEICDDGNTANGDGCSSTCTVEADYQCVGGNDVSADLCTKCGDGFVWGTEACDDNNTIAGDGCSSSCAVEAQYSCVNPSSGQVPYSFQLNFFY